MGGLDDLEQERLGDLVVGDDQLVEILALERGRARPGPGGDVPSELVVDPAAAVAERRAQVVDLVAGADEEHAAADAERAQHRPGDRLVAPAEQADHGRDGDRARRRRGRTS